MNDEIEVYAKVTNLGKETLSYVEGSSSCPNLINVQIINQKSKKYLAFKPVDRACTDDLSRSQLAPAQTVEQTFIFVPKYYGKSVLEPALPSTYDVFVSLPPEGMEITDELRFLRQPFFHCSANGRTGSIVPFFSELLLFLAV